MSVKCVLVFIIVLLSVNLDAQLNSDAPLPDSSINYSNYEPVELPQRPNYGPLTPPQWPNHEPSDLPQGPNYGPMVLPHGPNYSPAELPPGPDYGPMAPPQGPNFGPAELPHGPIYGPAESLQGPNYVPMPAPPGPPNELVQFPHGPSFRPVPPLPLGHIHGHVQDMPHGARPSPNFAVDPGPPDHHYPVKHAGLPLNLAVFPLPLENSDHELNLNVSWIRPQGSPASDYSLEVRSMTDTVDCQTPMCYEYNIPGESTWWLIPAFSSPVAETCAVRPGCAYMVRLIAHPWDGHTSANLLVELDECVANVCSCAHSPRLPEPTVNAQTVLLQGEVFVNVTWTLQPPNQPQRLPSGLKKQSYIVSVGKQMVSDAHPAPWFANTISRHVDADGLVTEIDSPRWLLLPIGERSPIPRVQNDERSDEQSDERSGNRRPKRLRNIMPDVKLLARVNLIDDRGCMGPAGNATAFDPDDKPSKFSFGAYAILVALGAAWVMGAVFALSARAVKHVLKSLRPAPVSAPLETISRRPAWFPLQPRTWSYGPSYGKRIPNDIIVITSQQQSKENTKELLPP